MCNEGECVSPYSPCQSPTPLRGNTSNHWCQKQHHYLQLCLQINCECVLLWQNSVQQFSIRRYQRCEVERHEHSVPSRRTLWSDYSRRLMSHLHWKYTTNHKNVYLYISAEQFITLTHRSGDEYNGQWTGSTLVQVMSCRPLGTKPLP